RDMAEEVRARRFRRDLFERLNYLQIHVPPLRERKEDIPDLLRHALDNLEGGRWIEVEPDALEYLAGRDLEWPGNVRNIEQLAALVVAEGSRTALTRRDLERLLEDVQRSWDYGSDSGGSGDHLSGTLLETTDAAEK